MTGRRSRIGARRLAELIEEVGDEFRNLFEFFYPGQRCELNVLAHAVETEAEGWIYVLFDARRVTPAKINEIVRSKIRRQVPG